MAASDFNPRDAGLPWRSHTARSYACLFAAAGCLTVAFVAQNPLMFGGPVLPPLVGAPLVSGALALMAMGRGATIRTVEAAPWTREQKARLQTVRILSRISLLLLAAGFAIWVYCNFGSTSAPTAWPWAVACLGCVALLVGFWGQVQAAALLKELRAPHSI